MREIQRSKGLLMRATGCQSAMRQMMTERSSAWLARKVPTCGRRSAQGFVCLTMRSSTCLALKVPTSERLRAEGSGRMRIMRKTIHQPGACRLARRAALTLWREERRGGRGGGGAL